MSSSDALSRLTVDDIGIDPTGRVVITNLEVAEALRDIGLDPVEATPGNNNGCNFVSGGCQTNTTAHCGAIVAEVE